MEKRELWMAFIDLEKAFDRVPREVKWWALRESGVESDTVVPTAVLPRVPAVLPRGRGHVLETLRDYRGNGS